ncbi:MAG: hypothetical protein HOB13_09870 [Lentimicrobiaceae bacterium]|nr:hypothetical protein [Lentimicrobiaceae bacterium]
MNSKRNNYKEAMNTGEKHKNRRSSHTNPPVLSFLITGTDVKITKGEKDPSIW